MRERRHGERASKHYIIHTRDVKTRPAFHSCLPGVLGPNTSGNKAATSCSRRTAGLTKSEWGGGGEECGLVRSLMRLENTWEDQRLPRAVGADCHHVFVSHFRAVKRQKVRREKRPCRYQRFTGGLHLSVSSRVTEVTVKALLSAPLRKSCFIGLTRQNCNLSSHTSVLKRTDSSRSVEFFTPVFLN